MAKLPDCRECRHLEAAVEGRRDTLRCAENRARAFSENAGTDSPFALGQREMAEAARMELANLEQALQNHRRSVHGLAPKQLPEESFR